MKKQYYIRNQKTDYFFDPLENKFYNPSWAIEYTDDKEWLQAFIDNEPERFDDCLIEEVTEEYTSQLCSDCGKCSKNYMGREKTCSFCHKKMHRDINGARNILLKNIKKHMSIA